MIEVGDRLGIRILPSRGQKIKDLTVFNQGVYWIHGPVLEDIEDALDEELDLTQAAERLYEQMRTVELSINGAGNFEFRFHDYPPKPWFARSIYDRHRWLAMVEASERSSLIFYTPHRYHALAASHWLGDLGYGVDVRCPDRLRPERPGQAPCTFGETAVTLRRHQEETLERAAERDYRIVVGDQPGLGKTISAGAILHQLYREGRIRRVLWVVPNSSLTEQVRGEMEDKFNTEVFVLTGETCGRARRLGLGDDGETQVEATEYERHGFVCTNWALFSKDFAKDEGYTEGITFDALVLDEAHRCQEGNLAYDAALALASPVRIVLSGTVMPNGKWDELFDMLNVVDPPAAPGKGYFEGMYYRYRDRLLEKMDERDAEVEAGRLTSKVALKYMLPKIVVHSKEEVMEGLPEIEENRIHINFGAQDKEVFAYFKDIIHGIIGELKSLPSPWAMEKRQKGRYYSLKAAMVMVYQDLRRFCAFGSNAVRGRLEEYLSGTKGVYRTLRDLFGHEIRRLRVLLTKAAQAPKNGKLIDYLRKSLPVRKAVVFCTEVAPNKRLALDLTMKGVPAKVIMGKGNRLTEEEAGRLGQPERFRDQDVEEVLDWFWMPWSALSSFLLRERDSGNLVGVRAGDREFRNFYYTSLAIDLPKGEGAAFEIELREPPEDLEDLASALNEDGFYRVEAEGSRLSLEYGREDKRVLVCTDKLQEGINLQDANCVVFYDYPFSIREREQRMSRVWRDGGRHPKIYVTYVMNGVEYNIERKLQEKYEKTSALGLPDPSPLSMMDLISII
jgi:hypothetical protein